MKIFLKMVSVASVVLFVGCGGGGGNPGGQGGLAYKGETARASLDKNETQNFLSVLNTSYVDMIDVPGSSHNKIVKKTSLLLKRLGKKANGATSGSVDMTEKKIDNVTRQIIAIFKNFNDGDGETLDGKVTYVVTVDAQESTFVKKMSIKFDMFHIKDGKTDIVMDGSIDVQVSDDGKRKTLTQNIVAKNNQDNTMMKFEGLKTVLDEYDREVSYRGKIYYSEAGYITVSTPVELTYDESGNPTVGGEILYEGKDATVKVRTAYDNRVRVEIDNGKDGTVNDVQVYKDGNFEQEIPNAAPVISITFPQSIYTDTDMSAVSVTVYDPDLDGFTSTYEWKVNDAVQSDVFELTNDKFVKHDRLKLTVVATDDRMGDVKSATQSKKQEVLNSRPIINASFSKLQLTIGDTADLEYTISDADDDILTVNWKHYLGGWIGDESFTSTDCQLGIEDYDMNHPDHTYETLTPYEQEDINNTYCPRTINGTIVSYPFINDHAYDAIAPGAYLHEMIVSDGEYNRTKVLESNISKSDIIKRQVNNHDQYSTTRAYNIFMKDFDGDGNKDLIYMGSITKHDDGSTETEPSGVVIVIEPTDYQVPALVVEYRNGDTILKREIYEVDAAQLDNFYVNDVNGDGKLDIVLTHTNGYAPPTNNSFGVMLQNNQGALDTEIKVTLSNYDALAISDVTGDGSADVILSPIDESYNDLGIQIFNEDGNITLMTSLPDGESKKILVKDLDTNGKKDIVVASKQFSYSKIEIELNIFSQGNAGNYTRKAYKAILNNEVKEYEEVTDIVISDLNGEKNLFIVSSRKHIYILKIENDALIVVKKLDYFNTKSKLSARLLDPVDINHDGKKDLIVIEPNSINLFGIFIQKEDNNFFSEQNYSFYDDDGYATDLFNPTYAFGDINKDGKYEIFFSTGEENLSAIYFK